ncbi:MAG: hypothetical protein WBI74_06225 [Caldicoprobacterales bacterium]|jgi:hypothetical protein|nr:hypothetical protein [Clostridiales bacterium]
MNLVRGLRKIFARKDPYTPPNEFKLNEKEKRSVILLFSILGCVAVISTLLYVIN